LAGLSWNTTLLKVDLATGEKPTPGYYWVTNIAAYTGARLGEVAQLTTNDIELRDNIWCFSFNNQNGKKIKTQSSIRKVPIHP